MRISSKSVYAMRALFDIAYHNGGRPTKVESIAEREEVPARFLEQIFQDLKAARLVGSKRGPAGGYFLLRTPEDIRLGDVIRAIEGPMERLCCFATDAEIKARCSLTSKCVTAAVWRDITLEIDALLDRVTLSELCQKGENLGVPREADESISYSI